MNFILNEQYSETTAANDNIPLTSRIARDPDIIAWSDNGKMVTKRDCDAIVASAQTLQDLVSSDLAKRLCSRIIGNVGKVKSGYVLGQNLKAACRSYRADHDKLIELCSHELALAG